MNDNKIIYFPGMAWKPELRGRWCFACKAPEQGFPYFYDVPFSRVGNVVASCFAKAPPGQMSVYFMAHFPATQQLLLPKLEVRPTLTSDNTGLSLPFESTNPEGLATLLTAYLLEVVASNREHKVLCSADRDGWFGLYSDWHVDHGLPDSARRQATKMLQTSSPQ